MFGLGKRKKKAGDVVVTTPATRKKAAMDKRPKTITKNVKDNQ